MDLNIDNYEFNDILNLFNLNYNFTRDDLKKTKRIVLKTHPDKCDLDTEYFLFFTKAYKILYSIYEIRERSNQKIDYDKEDLYNKEDKNLLEDFINSPNFNKLFNEQFEKHNLDNLSKSEGYGDWLKSDEDINNDTVTKNNMNEYINNKKKELSALLPIHSVNEIVNDTYTSLVDNKVDNYSSHVFSSFQYEDLKKAHTETVIPVTIDDGKNKMNKSLENYKNERCRQDINPLSEIESRKILADRKLAENRDDITRLYHYTKEHEKMKNINDKLMSTFKRLT